MGSPRLPAPSTTPPHDIACLSLVFFHNQFLLGLPPVCDEQIDQGQEVSWVILQYHMSSLACLFFLKVHPSTMVTQLNDTEMSFPQ